MPCAGRLHGQWRSCPHDGRSALTDRDARGDRHHIIHGHGANTDILLDTQANNFGGAWSFAGAQSNFRDVQLRNINVGATVPVLAGLTNLRNLTLTFDSAAMTVPTLMASGNVNLTAGGSINQSGAVTVGGTTALATTVAGSDFLLDTLANNFVGVCVVRRHPEQYSRCRRAQHQCRCDHPGLSPA